MTNIILDNISLVLLLPLWIFLIIMCGRFFAVYVNKKIIYCLTLLSSFLGIIACIVSLYNYETPINWIYPFIKINNFALYFGLRIDKLSLIMGVILFLISFLVQWYSISYMKEDKKNYKFFAYLNLFNFAMSFLVFSPNLYQMYVFWELVGIVSYLLIGFDYQNIIKSNASKKVFIINRIGDTAFITAIILLSFFMTSYSGNPSLAQLAIEDLNVISVLLSANTSPLGFNIICGLFIFAAMIKSAQFPFHIWLQDAMEAKLPVSALLHSSTMVACGVFLVITMIPLLSFSPHIMTSISIIGITSAILCSLMASVENHPKKLLAYSTSANFGLIFFAIGISNIRAALVFLTAHAILKSSLFLLLPKENKTNTIYNFVLSIISVLSLSGIIFSGLAGKELIYHPIEYNTLLKILYLAAAFFTAFYLSRLICIIFRESSFEKKINLTEFLPNFVLLICNIFLYISFRGLYTLSEPFAAALAGIGVCILLYKKNLLEFNFKNNIVEKFCYCITQKLYEITCKLCNFIEIKIFSNYKCLIFVPKQTVKTVNIIEEKIMNGAVKLTNNALANISKTNMVLQSGNIQKYNLYALIFITITILLIIIGYMFILNMI